MVNALGMPKTIEMTMAEPNRFIATRIPPSYQGNRAGYSETIRSAGGPMTAHHAQGDGRDEGANCIAGQPLSNS